MKNSVTAIIILAAGNSSRLGLPKQLLQYKTKSFLRIIAEKALAAHASEVIIVLGFDYDRMRREVEDLPVRFVQNRGWLEGIASSVRAGIEAVRPQAEGGLICLCDQPGVTTELFIQLISVCTHEKPISATEYNEILGVPACFDRSIFPELLQLQGDAGARRVIARVKRRVAACPYPQAAVDIDTPEDYRQRLSSED